MDAGNKAAAKVFEHVGCAGSGHWNVVRATGNEIRRLKDGGFSLWSDYT
jgi:hypothetical protein